jgi:HAD superfamily hydrolase (TIGR01549 family)
MILAETTGPDTGANRSRSTAERSPFAFAAWLIDLDGTLYRQNMVRSVMAVELALWGRSAISTLRTFRREHERLRNGEPSGAGDPFAQQMSRTANRLNMPEQRVADIVNHWMIDRPGKWLRMFRRRTLLEGISKFRAQGGRTAIVSDYPARQKLRALQVTDLFDVVVACGEPGGPDYLKPSPAGYLLAADRLGISPCDCLVIGDRQDADGEAARRAGIAFQLVASRWPRN